MVQHQSVQKLELPDAEITHCSRRVAFLSHYTHPYVRLLDHPYVIPPVSDRQHHQTQLLLHKSHYYRLLLW